MSNSEDMTKSQTEICSLMEKIRSQFRPGGKWAPIEDLAEYERQINALPADERALSQEVTIYANICRFFSERDWVVPYHIRQAVREAATLDTAERTARIREVNEALMENIHDASPDIELRM